MTEGAASSVKGFSLNTILFLAVGAQEFKREFEKAMEVNGKLLGLGAGFEPPEEEEDEEKKDSPTKLADKLAAEVEKKAVLDE